MASPVHVVTVRALTADLKGFLDRVRSGDVLVIVERKTPIAFITPPMSEITETARVESILVRLKTEGRVTWEENGPLGDFTPVRNTGRPASEVIVEERGGSR